MEAGEERLYDYITEEERLAVLEKGYAAMLSGASPFLKTYPAARTADFWQVCRERYPERWCTILNGLSLPTMPEGLLERMLDREGITGAMRELLAERYQKRRAQLCEMLERGSVNEILCLPDSTSVRDGGVKLNLGAEMIPASIAYTPAEYVAHLAEIRELVNREKNYHLTLLPPAPFRDLQIFTLKDAVAVLRCREPNTAFAFLNETLARSVADYCGALIRRYAEDRYTTSRALGLGD